MQAELNKDGLKLNPEVVPLINNQYQARSRVDFRWFFRRFPKKPI